MKNKIIYALVSLVIAFGLWTYVVTVVSPESEETFYKVPVVWNNEVILNDKGLMVLPGETPTITLKLKGNRTDLNNLKSSDIAAVVDLAKIDDGGEKKLGYSLSYPGNTTYEVIDQYPQQISVSIAESATKEVDVKLSCIGSTPPDYIADIDGVTLSHEKVSISGPKAVLEQITQAVIEVNLDGQSQSVIQTSRYTLCDDNGKPVDAKAVTVSVSEVDMTLRILRVKEVELKLDVLYGGGSNAENTQIMIEPQTIKVAGGDKLLESLESISLGTVDLAKLAEGGTFTYPINLPKGVENLSDAAEAKVTIQFQGLVTKELTVSPIAVRSSSGVTVTLGKQQLNVVVRGPKAQIDAITAANVHAVVDCTGAELGSEQFDVQFNIDGGFDAVGVVGSYPIVATLS